MIGSAWTILFFSISISNCSFRAELISWEVTAPKSLPPFPALAFIMTWMPVSFWAFSWARAFSFAIWAALAFSLSFRAFMLSAVASLASFLGSR